MSDQQKTTLPGREETSTARAAQAQNLPSGVTHQTTEIADLDELHLSVLSVECGALEKLVDALRALKDAATVTNNGFAADDCEQAAQLVRRAMRRIGG